ARADWRRHQNSSPIVGCFAAGQPGCQAFSARVGRGWDDLGTRAPGEPNLRRSSKVVETSALISARAVGKCRRLSRRAGYLLARLAKAAVGSSTPLKILAPDMIEPMASASGQYLSAPTAARRARSSIPGHGHKQAGAYSSARGRGTGGIHGDDNTGRT